MMKTYLHRVGATLLAVASSVAAAADYPSQPITIVVPYTAGGGSDIMARRLGDLLHRELGQNVIVDNRPGSGGNIGAAVVARARPDGYTLMLTAAPFAIAPAMYKQLAFRPIEDFTPIAQVALVPLILVVRPDSPLHTVADLVAASKVPNAHVTFASFGNGSPPHLVGESINMLGGAKMTHVPYKGSAAAMPDLLGGRVDVAILDAVAMTPFVKSGQVRALAITGPKRSPVLPRVPTLAEAGIDFKTVGWHGLFGPAHMPADVVARLNAAVNKIDASSEMKQFIVAGGSIPIEPPLDAAQWAAQFKDDVRVWADAAQRSGASLD